MSVIYASSRKALTLNSNQELYFLPEPIEKRLLESLITANSLDESYASIHPLLNGSISGFENLTLRNETSAGRSIILVNRGGEKPLHEVDVYSKSSHILFDKCIDGQLISYVGNLDYLYTTRLWDWWIEPVFERKKLKNQNRSVIHTAKISQSELQEILRGIHAANYRVDAIYNCNQHRSVEVYRQMIEEAWPLKLALISSQMETIVKSTPHDLQFILRGGKFLSDILSDTNNPKLVSKEFLSGPNGFAQESQSNVYVDDAIGTGKTARLLPKGSKLIVADTTLPVSCYRFLDNVEIFAPIKYLSIYAMRLFEDNPLLLGINSDGSQRTPNAIRRNIVNNIRSIKANSTSEDLEKRLVCKLKSFVPWD